MLIEIQIEIANVIILFGCLQMAKNHPKIATFIGNMIRIPEFLELKKPVTFKSC
jgi:hypothetical protein